MIYAALFTLAAPIDRGPLLDAICQVESSGNAKAVGDAGRSRGAYQVGRAAWIDAGVPWPYTPHDQAKSREVCRRYCLRYAGANASNEAWARTWNGGPNGMHKRATVGYWNKVRKAMR